MNQHPEDTRKLLAWYAFDQEWGNNWPYSQKELTHLVIMASGIKDTYTSKALNLRLASTNAAHISNHAAACQFTKDASQCDEYVWYAEFAITRAKELTAVLNAKERPDPLGDALNSGDGVYRP